MDPIVSVLWGVLVYNETTRTGGWLVLATAGMIVLAVGVIGLARSPVLAAMNEDDHAGSDVPGRRDDEVPHSTVPGTS
jgi:hypothetical protein